MRVLSVFGSRPLSADYDLDIMQPGQTLNDVFARVMSGLDPILAQFIPDYVLVQGDTATSTAAAMAAFFRGIKVGQVEAGLRTGTLKSPWPEDANRRLTAGVFICALRFPPFSSDVCIVEVLSAEICPGSPSSAHCHSCRSRYDRWLVVVR